jgi:hypothetical protein
MIYFSRSCFQERDMLLREMLLLFRVMDTRDTIQKTYSSAMEVRRHKSKGTTPCPYCSCAVNNFHIGRHISREHTQRAAASTLLTRAVQDRNTPPPPNNDGPVRDEAQIEDDSNFEAVITDDEYDEDDELVTSDDDDDSNIDAELDDEDDEAEKTVEDYLRDLTDDTYRTDIQYDPKRVLKYLSWTKRPLTEIEHETIRFLRCASFGNGLSKAHANEWLAYERELGGRAELLPKTIDTLWSTMERAHRSMSDAICHRTVEIDIPLEVHIYLLPHLKHHIKWAQIMNMFFDHF